MSKFFSAIKLGYELVAAILAIQQGLPYVWYPVYQGTKVKVTVERI